MILPPSATRARALPQRHALKPQPCRKTSVKVSALFGGKAPAASKDGGNVEELRNTAKRFGGPSEAANKAVAQAVRSCRRTSSLWIPATSGLTLYTMQRLNRRDPRASGCVNRALDWSESLQPYHIRTSARSPMTRLNQLRLQELCLVCRQSRWDALIPTHDPMTCTASGRSYTPQATRA